MKKNFKKLVLNKSTLSNLENNEIIGGVTKLSVNNYTCDCLSVQFNCDNSFNPKCDFSVNIKCLPDPPMTKGCTAKSLCVKCH